MLREIQTAKSFRAGGSSGAVAQSSRFFVKRQMDMLVVQHANDALLEEAVLEEMAVADGDLRLGAPGAGPSRNRCALDVLEEEKSKEYDEEYESRSRRRRMNGTEELKVSHTVTYNEEQMQRG